MGAAAATAAVRTRPFESGREAAAMLHGDGNDGAITDVSDVGDVDDGEDDVSL